MGKAAAVHRPVFGEGPDLASGVLANPKLLRRPTQFARTAEVSARVEMMAEEEAPVILPVPGPAAAIVTSPTASWQDDPRFGLMMVGVVVVVNLLLALGLPLLHSSQAPASPPVIVQTSPAVKPGVTFYSRTDPISESNPTLMRAVTGMVADDAYAEDSDQ